MNIRSISIFVLVIVFFNSAYSQINQSEELGQVRWMRDYQKAISLAKKDKKDVLILFQEVPGCATCRNYGHNVLSHPLMVEAIENLFIPLAIFNNKGGKDREILMLYDEPTWNNPVVRIINGHGENVVQRISNDYSALTLCRRMKEALIQRNVQIPEYFKLLEQELASMQTNSVSEKYYKMYCFWSGEKQLGNIDGVLDTEAGFYKFNEVVKVTFDNDVLDENELNEYADSFNYRPVEVSEQSYKVAANDVHYYLQRSAYRFLPLTEIQQTKINSALGNHQNPDSYLSPKQREWLKIIKQSDGQNTPVSNMEFFEAWHLMNSKEK